MPRALNDRSSALTAQNLIALPERFGCPVWAYDGDIIAERINQLRHLMLSASRKKPVRISIYCA